MKTWIKYCLIAALLGLTIGYFLGQNDEDREFESRVILKDYNTGENVEYKEIKAFPRQKVTKDQEFASKGNIYFETGAKTFAILKIKATGYKTKIVFVKLDKDVPLEIKIMKKGDRKLTDVEKENKGNSYVEEEEKEEEKLEKVELKPEIK